MIPTDSDFNQCLSGLQELSHFGGLTVPVAADAGIRRKTVSLVSPSSKEKFQTAERKTLHT
jgi:hypothetical protein